jgi:hypothetical protein
MKGFVPLLDRLQQGARRTMSKAAVFLTCAGMLLNASCSWRVEPGPVVTLGSPKPVQVSGSVTLKSSDDGNDSKTGGGCLIFLDPANPGKRCTEQKDCEIGETTGYCADMGNFPPPEEKTGAALPGAGRCWYQPATPSCLQSPYDPLPDGKSDFNLFIPVHPSAAPPGVTVPPPDRPILWRVVSCQNVTDVKPPEKPGCKSKESSKKILRYGEVSRFE